MTGVVAALLRTVTVPTIDGRFNVRRLPKHPAYYVGRDASGSAAILIRASGPGRAVPLRLAGIEARFGVPCQVTEQGSSERIETLTVIICQSRDIEIETYFASSAEILIELLGRTPKSTAVDSAIQRLVELFRKLSEPPRRTLIGLVGELTVILAARDTAAAISAWRADADDRYDFVIGRLRVDAKASTDRRRSHSLSFEQANPPPGTIGLLASVWVESVGGGISVGEQIAAIESSLSNDNLSILRLRSVVADTLGESLLRAMEWRFDPAVAASSLAFFDMRSIPAIRPPLPAAVTGVRFVSNLDGGYPITLGGFIDALDNAEMALLPLV